MSEDIFNHKDSFYYRGTPRAIEDFYFNYKDRLEKLMQNFLRIEFEVKQELTGAVVYVNDERFILYCLITYTIYGDSMSAISVRRILELITMDADIYINKYHYFDSKSRLMSSGILVLSHEPYSSIGLLEVSNTLITFVNSKIVFAFLEKESYDLILDITNKENYIDTKSKKKIIKEPRILTPKEIVSELNKTVIGQDDAKKALSVHAYLHCLRINGIKIYHLGQISL